MEVLGAIFGCLFWPVLGFFVGQIAQRVAVPIIVNLIGNKYFVSQGAFDGCSLGITAAFVTLILQGVLSDPKVGFSPFYSLILVGVFFTDFGLALRWTKGLKARKREWTIRNEVIYNSKGEILNPTFVMQDSIYFQTDAYNGYSIYVLSLHNETGLLGRNLYPSEEESQNDLATVEKLCQIRFLDLYWVWQAEPRKWRYARFPSDWALTLCGNLDKLSNDDRIWWRKMVFPEFAARIGTTIDVQEAKNHIVRLREAYPELLVSGDPTDSVFQLNERFWADFNFTLSSLLESATDPLLLADRKKFEEMAGQACEGQHISLLHETDGWLILSDK